MKVLIFIEVSASWPLFLHSCGEIAYLNSVLGAEQNTSIITLDSRFSKVRHILNKTYFPNIIFRWKWLLNMTSTWLPLIFHYFGGIIKIWYLYNNYGRTVYIATAIYSKKMY